MALSSDLQALQLRLAWRPVAGAFIDKDGSVLLFFVCEIYSWSFLNQRLLFATPASRTS
jgi:hypothetical protein